MVLRLGGLLLAGALLTPGQVTKNTAETDAILHDQVSVVLTMDMEIRGGGIQVDVKNGAVTLRGKVKDEKARQKATKVVKKMKNVASVDNQLKLADEK